MLESIKARFYGKPFDIHKEEIAGSGNDGYYLYNGVIYYGCRWFVFIVSSQNQWYQERQFSKWYEA